MKSKFRRRLYKLNKPSTKEINNEQQMNEEQKACDRLREQSLYQFEENDKEDDNPYLNRNFKFHKIKTQTNQRSHQHKYQNTSSLQKTYVKPHMRALPLVSMQQRISQCSKSVSTSPRRKLPLSLTQYIIMDAEKSEDTTLVKKSINFLKQKYIKALSYPNKRNQTLKKSTLYFNFSSTSTKIKVLNINQDQKKKKN